MTLRKCIDCNKVKSEDQFYKPPNRKRQAYCIPCKSTRQYKALCKKKIEQKKKKASTDIDDTLFRKLF